MQQGEVLKVVRMQLKEDPECEWLKFTRLCWGVSIPGQKGLMCQWDSSAAASELTFDPWVLPSPGNQSFEVKVRNKNSAQ